MNRVDPTVQRSFSQPASSAPQEPGWSIAGIARRIASVCIMTFLSFGIYVAAFVAPQAVAVGFIGAAMYEVAVRGAMWAAGKSQWLRESRIYPLIDDIVGIGVTATTLYKGALAANNAFRTTLAGGFLVTYFAYCAPSIFVHEVRELFS